MNEKLLTERAERLNKILKEKGAGFHVEYMNVYKNNVYMDAYALRKEESDAAPIIYFDMEWWEKSDAQVVDFLISMNRNDYDIDTSKIITHDYISEHIKPKLLSDSYIPNLKKADRSFIHFEDMVVSFYVSLEESPEESGIATIPVTNSLLEDINISLLDAYAYAIKNISSCVEIIPISSLIPGNIPMSSDCPMWIVRTTDLWQGAAAILCPDTLDKISELIPGNVALLPSSVEEFIAVSYESESDLEILKEMVTDINEMQIPIQMKLTDNVYVLKEGKIKSVF